MKPFEIVGLPPDELTAFLSAAHPDPFRVLGPHQSGDDLTIRVFRPDAQQVEIVVGGSASEPIAAEKIHRDGFFCARVWPCCYDRAMRHTAKILLVGCLSGVLGVYACGNDKKHPPTPSDLTGSGGGGAIGGGEVDGSDDSGNTEGGGVEGGNLVDASDGSTSDANVKDAADASFDAQTDGG